MSVWWKLPQWWKDSNGSLDLLDENIVAAVFQKVDLLEKEFLESVKKEGEKAKEELKTIIATNTPAVDLTPKVG